MSKRVLENLIIENEDFVVFGDLEITGNLIIKNGHSLIVSGDLSIVVNQNNLSELNGHISAGMIRFKRGTSTSMLLSGDIFSAHNLHSHVVIICDDIDVQGDAFAHAPINCKNYMVNGNNDSDSVTAIESIRILGSSDSYSLVAKTIHIEHEANLNSSCLIASESAYIGGSINDCGHLTVKN